MCGSPLFLSKNTGKKMEEIKSQKNIIFISTDKRLKLVSRYIRKKHEKYLEQADKKKTLALFFMLDTL